MLEMCGIQFKILFVSCVYFGIQQKHIILTQREYHLIVVIVQREITIFGHFESMLKKLLQEQISQRNILTLKVLATEPKHKCIDNKKGFFWKNNCHRIDCIQF